MTTDFASRRAELLQGFRDLRRATPDVMAGFNQLHRAATADGALSARQKELIAIGISVAGKCEGCIALHVHAALRAGATAEEIQETVGVAILMGGGPAAVYGAEALDALEQFRALHGNDSSETAAS